MGWLTMVYSIVPWSWVPGWFPAPASLPPFLPSPHATVNMAIKWPHTKCFLGKSQAFPPSGDILCFQMMKSRLRAFWFLHPFTQLILVFQRSASRPSPGLWECAEIKWTADLLSEASWWPRGINEVPPRLFVWGGFANWIWEASFNHNHSVGAEITAPGHLLPLQLAQPPSC